MEFPTLRSDRKRCHIELEAGLKFKPADILLKLGFTAVSWGEMALFEKLKISEWRDFFERGHFISFPNREFQLRMVKVLVVSFGEKRCAGRYFPNRR